MGHRSVQGVQLHAHHYHGHTGRQGTTHQALAFRGVTETVCAMRCCADGITVHSYGIITLF